MNVTVIQALQFSKENNHIILDVRTASEISNGTPKGAVCLNLNHINELALNKLCKDNTYYVICQSGHRSLLAIEKLKLLGFDKLFLIKNGFESWQKEDLPIDFPQIEDNEIRYERHYQLQGFGINAQQALLKSHVLLIGVGGLGSSATLYLAAAGIGKITLVDDDIVQLSNLQRQVIHHTDSINQLKVESAKNQILALNANVKVNTIAEKLNEENANQLISQVDLVIDGSDNLKTRYLVNDICHALSKPLVYAAVYKYEAQVSVFDFRNKDSACLRCLFPKTEGFEPANCSTEGVLGVVPGLAGIIQATEAIKLITNVGQILDGELLVYDLLSHNSRKIKYSLDTKCELHSKII